MKVAIVGAGGLVGSEFTRQLSTQHDVLSFSHDDLDITDRIAVERTMRNERPALIINCAVLGVDSCEMNPPLALSVNVNGAENLARAAATIDAEIVHLSSNYVFDGRRSNGAAYTPDDAPDPINVYGKTKLAGERAVKDTSPRSFIIRTSWVFGLNKENFFSAAPRRLRAKQQISAIIDVFANCTYAPDLVARIMEIVSRGSHGTYHVVNSGLCSYYGFALEAARILRMSERDLNELIVPVGVQDLRLRAERPKYSPLSCSTSAKMSLAPLRDWRAALAEYIESA
ncbi:MAG TPA: dTDP-4-dehydrorhamnose reductase [Pyrinomonadaceae bacterium]|nr:dTDP-4-dehydrorhamnose reductase [Pyrinomonadaceae bacterium]